MISIRILASLLVVLVRIPAFGRYSRLGQNIHPSADKIKIVLFHLVAEKGVVDQVNPSRHGIPQAIYKPEGDALFDSHGIRGLEKEG